MSSWSTNNYGNVFLAYYEPNCSENKWNAEPVPAGSWCHKGSACMHNYKQTDSVTSTVYHIRSIGPDLNSKYFSRCKSALQKDVLKLEQKQDQHFSSLATKNDQQLENKIKTLLTEIQAIKEKKVELEIKQENWYRSLEDSFEKLKGEFDNFDKKLEHKLSKLVSD